MKKLTLIIVVFVFAISVPLIYFVMQTFRSIEQDERDELRYFAETLFDQIEEELNALAVQEESRAIDEYNFYYKPAAGAGFSNPPVSLQQQPVQSYILGYLQNNPDGSFQTPHADLAGPIPSGRTRLIAGLHKINALFNKKRSALSEKIDLQQARRLIDKDVPQR
ncbi:MAG: hypothetical protein GY868_07290, partial [Deltaproteobacteria bacterium]|nr:hypothetical protein [Deltaproteobacteria bacterium]